MIPPNSDELTCVGVLFSEVCIKLVSLGNWELSV